MHSTSTARGFGGGGGWRSIASLENSENAGVMRHILADFGILWLDPFLIQKVQLYPVLILHNIMQILPPLCPLVKNLGGHVLRGPPASVDYMHEHMRT